MAIERQIEKAMRRLNEKKLKKIKEIPRYRQRRRENQRW